MRMGVALLTVVFCASLHAEQFDVDFSRAGAAALRDHVSNTEIRTNATPAEKNLIDSSAGKVWCFSETTQAAFPVKSGFHPPMTIEMCFCPTQRPLGPVSGLLQQFGYGRDGFRIMLSRYPTVVSFHWDADGKEYLVDSTSSLAIGQWHHLALTLDQDNVLKIYLDGRLDVTKRLEPAFVPAAAGEVLLGRISGQISPYVGLLRSVKVSDTVKSDFSQAAADLQKWAATPSVPPTPKTGTAPQVDVGTLFTGELASVGFNGDLAASINGHRTEPVNIKPVEITSTGDFTPGVSQKAFDLKPYHVISYPAPQGFPPAKGGTISVWIKPADWFSPKAVEAIRKTAWLRRKTIFHADDLSGQRERWSLRLDIIGDPRQQVVRCSASVGGAITLFHQARLELQRWYLLTVTWEPDGLDARRMRAKLYLNGEKVDEALADEMPLQPIGANLNIGSTNPGVSYTGQLDDFHLLDHPLSGAEVLGYYRQIKPAAQAAD